MVEMTKEEFRELCTLLGGQSETARLLGLSASRNLRKVIKGDLKVPAHWIENLKPIALEKSKQLIKFYES
tara:strand:+ start:525 stop:734 length:210 start_codon:yes stop_codon:yes gene_type:complete